MTVTLRPCAIHICFFFFFNDTATTEIYTLSLHDALPISLGQRPSVAVYGGDYPTPDGTCVRDYVHVADLADAHVGALRFLEERGASDRFNLGTGRGASVKNVLEAARRVTGRRIAADVVARRPGDPPQLVADLTRAVESLGWRPKYPELEVQIEHAWK